jgi:phosphoribosylamine--glycine ligase
MEKVRTSIIEPTVKGLIKDNLDYKGFLFFGLIKVGDDPFVIEYNCRMGDPETEAVIPRIKNDLLDLFVATARGELNTITINKDPRYATTIVAVSGGYPNDYEKGFQIRGLKAISDDALIFHSGTKEDNGKILTNGGRVICATALADTLDAAINEARELIDEISFEGKYYRRDIGYEFVKDFTE